MSATIREIVNDALGIIGEVAGAGVQEFSEDRSMADAIRGFNMLFKKYHWHQFRKWYSITLDGTLGIPTTDSFERVIDFEDFMSITRDKEDVPLPILPKTKNPSTVSGTQVRYWSSMHVTDANYKKRKLQFYPFTAVGIVNVQARVYPQPASALNWDWNDILYLDRDLLAYGAAYATLASDDLNPNAAEIVKGLMESRFKDIIAGLADHRIPIEQREPIPSQWYER